MKFIALLISLAVVLYGAVSFGSGAVGLLAVYFGAAFNPLHAGSVVLGVLSAFVGLRIFVYVFRTLGTAVRRLVLMTARCFSGAGIMSVGLVAQSFGANDMVVLGFVVTGVILIAWGFEVWNVSADRIMLIGVK